MISWSSVWAVVLRHARMWRRDPNFLLGGFYWPLLDVLMWGFLGTWIAQSTSSLPNYQLVALMGILLWQIIGRGSNTMLLCLCEELWSKNIVNFFSMPLRIIEWMLGVIIFTGITLFLILIVSISAMYFFQGISPITVIPIFFMFCLPLFFSCLCVGFICLQVVILSGRRGTELAFVVAWFLMPFSGAFYPIDVLPSWAQTLSAFLPMRYVFQGMRGYVMYQQDPAPFLLKGYIMSIFYATAAIIIFVYCFKRSKTKGLARLCD